MSVMAERKRVVQQPSPLDQFWPDDDRPLTVDDLRQQPDDGNRYELVNGILQVTPAPLNDHQFVLTRLTILLDSWCPRGELRVLSGPGMNLAKDLHRIPDLAVVRTKSLKPEFVDRPPALAVEIASRNTRKVDRTDKKREYAAFGIASYWIVVPDQDRPSLTAYELRGTAYKQVVMVAGDERFEAERPFPLGLVPSLLVADDDEGWRSLLKP